MTNGLTLTVFGLAWALVLYGVNCLIARKFILIKLKLALLYILVVATIGVFGEIFLDTTYRYFVGVPLWKYDILPIHYAYTSSYAVVVWGLYGFHLYLLHGTILAKRHIRTRYLALIFCLEALLAEALLTISAKLYLGDYLYYYSPGDVWHVTSFQNIPFYYICGAVIVKTIERVKHAPIYFSIACVFLLSVVVFLV